MLINTDKDTGNGFNIGVTPTHNKITTTVYSGRVLQWCRHDVNFTISVSKLVPEKININYLMFKLCHKSFSMLNIK